MPLEELEFVVKLKKPDYIYTHLTSVNSRFNFEKFLETIGERMKQTTLIASGRVAQGYYKKPPGNVRLKNSLPDVITELA